MMESMMTALKSTHTWGALSLDWAWTSLHSFPLFPSFMIHFFLNSVICIVHHLGSLSPKSLRCTNFYLSLQGSWKRWTMRLKLSSSVSLLQYLTVLPCFCLFVFVLFFMIFRLFFTFFSEKLMFPASKKNRDVLFSWVKLDWLNILSSPIINSRNFCLSRN